MKTNKKEIKMNDCYGVELVDTFWKLTYLDGEIEYTEFAPYSNKSYYEYERLESVGNPVIKFELVKADKSNNDLRFVSVA
jgi:hypothetical protein